MARMLVNGFKVTKQFLDEPLVLHSEKSHVESDCTGEGHAMVLVGAWEEEDGH